MLQMLWMEIKLCRERCVRCAHDKAVDPKACVQLSVLVAVLWRVCEDDSVD